MTKNPADLLLDQHLDYLKLPYLKENCQPLAAEGAANHWSHLDYLGRLIQGEVATRQDRVIARRIKAASFSGHQNPGSLPLGLAKEDQSAPDPGTLPTALHRRKSQRYLLGVGRPGQNPLGHSTRLRRLPART